MHKTRGFTLVELAIVLVIIGIIVGAILKGTELINNSKVKRLENDLRGLEAKIWTFYDRTGKLPGDCDRDGTIDYKLPTGLTPPSFSTSTAVPNSLCSGATGTQDSPFDELRYTELFPQTAANIDLARTPFSGGFFVIGNNGTAGYNAIAIYNIPAWAAKMIDVSIDGSESGTNGRIRRWDTINEWPNDQNQNVSLIYYFDKM